MRILIHIVTWNNERTITGCLEAAIAQSGFTLGESLRVHVTDNASHDGTWAILERFEADGVTVTLNRDNLGFSGGQNQGAAICIAEHFDAILILNPDVRLEPGTLIAMVAALDAGKRVSIVTPKLLRADEELQPLQPPIFDAAGMILNSSLRHLDRGAGEIVYGQYENPEPMFGGTGACLLITRDCIEDLAVPPEITSDRAVFEIYPQLEERAAERVQLFDEAFFAYREDADLAWRAKHRGWICMYQPKACAYHVRRVTPDRRTELPPELNLYGVRNRFLLQLNNWRLRDGIGSALNGLVVRNLVVIAGVLIREQSSLPALGQALRLTRRALRIRRYNDRPLVSKH